MAINLSKIFDYVAPAPTYLGKLQDANLITADDLASLKQQSMVKGLLAAGLGYLAQPKNQRFGSPLPYLGKAGLMGLQAMQQPYNQFARDFEIGQKITQQNRTKQEVDKLVEADPSLSFLQALPASKQAEFIVQSNLLSRKPVEANNMADRYALSMFKAPFSSLNSQQQAEVLEATKQRDIDIKTQSNLSDAMIDYSYKTIADYRTEAQNSRKIQTDLLQMEEMLDEIYASGEETGPTEQIATKYQSMLNNFGIKKNDIVGKKEFVNAIAQGLAKKQRTPGEGIMTDADFRVFENIVPGLGKSEQANRYLIASMKKLNQRNIEVSQMANKYMQQHGYLKPEFFTMLDRYFEQNPLFTPKEVSDMERLQEGKENVVTKQKNADSIVFSDDLPPTGEEL
jgi:hypothetical protein